MTDNLSRTLRKTALSTAEAQPPGISDRTLQGLQMVEAWATFYTHVQHYKRSSVSARQFFPGGGKLRDNSDGNRDGFHTETAEDMYHVAYIEAIDLAISTIQDRFDQPGYAMY